MEIYFAAGCFWGVQKLFSQIEGVTFTSCGYVNGKEDIIPDYQRVCKGDTDYKECVHVVYDDTKISLAKLLSVFFYVIDPSQADGQGHDIGSQYHTGIYYTNEKDHLIILNYIETIRSSYSSFYTEVLPLSNFYDAEDYHQDYLVKNPNGYCHIPSIKYEEVKELVCTKS